MHAIALVVAHRGEASFTTADVADLFGLLGASDTALARMMSTRARSAAERAPTRSETVDYEVEVSVDEDLAARRAALVTQRQGEAWPALADTIRELIRDGVDHGEPDEDEQLELLLELGRIEADRLGDPTARSRRGAAPRRSTVATTACSMRWRRCSPARVGGSTVSSSSRSASR